MIIGIGQFPRSAGTVVALHVLQPLRRNTPTHDCSHIMMRPSLDTLALVLLLAAGAVWALTHRHMLDLESIEPVLRALGIWAPIGFIVIYAAARCCSSPARCSA